MRDHVGIQSYFDATLVSTLLCSIFLHHLSLKHEGLKDSFKDRKDIHIR